ncbi:MAG: gliding motility-associated C-terminal domain-containing protein [Bacteroidota bacterium]
MNKIATLILTLLLFNAKAIQPATLKCIQVDNGGIATITWQVTTDVSDFVSYQLYFSNSLAGPYNIISTITNPSTNNYIHNSASADINNCFYFIKTIGSISTGYSDTLQAIQLVLSNINDGNAQLHWNAPSSPLPSAQSWYYVFKEFPVGTWALLDSTQNLNYIEIFSLCDVQVSYKIVLSGTGCINQSATDAEHIKDLAPPDTPTLDSVSVSPVTSEINIGWQPSIASDTKGYIIYIQQGGVWTPIDTIYGINNTFYNYNNPLALTSPQNYRIAALDSCMNASPLSIDQHSLVLSFSTNACQQSASLSWNAYDHLPGDVAKYEIFMSINGGVYTKIDQVINGLTYTYTGLIHNSSYKFFIRMVGNNGITSSSSVISFLFQQTNLPSVVYFRYASVNEQQTVDLGVYVDTSAAISQLLIYKKNPTTAFDLLASLPFSIDGLYYFTDNNVSTSKMSYQYYARIIDNCGNEIMYSDTVKTILLQGIGNNNYQNTLSWLPYQQFNVPIATYDIYRSIGESTVYDSINFTNSSINTYFEDVTPLRYNGAVFNYYVEAIESNGNSFGFKDISRSNTTTIHQQSLTFIPNAFTPEGINKVFKPTNIFVNPTNYSFLIFSRSGAKVFETNNPNEGWDGTINGVVAPIGLYCYRLIYNNSNEDLFEKDGWVILVK